MSVAKDRMKEHLPRTSPVPQAGAAIPDHEILIVGAGFAGIGTAIELKRRGIESFQIIELGSDVGGTWRDNRYPGIAVDITSFVYSYSFELNSEWSRVYAPGAELQNYTRRVASKYGLYPHIRFGVSVSGATFDEQRHLWQVQTNCGLITSRHLISAAGGLLKPKLPDIDGIDTFQGKLIHTARWDHDYDLSGKRVAVIGTGATAVQLIPEIASKVSQLDVYQRTPIWVLRKYDGKLPAWLRTAFRWSGLLQQGVRASTATITEAIMVIAAVYYRRAPGLVRWLEKAGLDNLREQLPDRPDLWEKLTPSYGFACKRPSFSNNYFSTFGREGVELITTPIERITANGVVTRDGVERKIDVLIAATGFKLLDAKDNFPPFEVVGRDGQELHDFWMQNRYQAYEGLTVPGFPNLYIHLGPNALVGSSYFVMVEGNATHIARCIETARARDATCVEVRQDVHDRYFEQVQTRMQGTVFLNNNCATANSYYFDHRGDAPVMRPSTGAEMLWRAAHLPMDNYRFTRAPET